MIHINIKAYLEKLNDFKSKTVAALELGRDPQSIDQYLRVRKKKIVKEYSLINDDVDRDCITQQKEDSKISDILVDLNKGVNKSKACSKRGLTVNAFEKLLKKQGLWLTVKFVLVSAP